MQDAADTGPRVEPTGKRPGDAEAETQILDPEDTAERDVRVRRAQLRQVLALAILGSTMVLAGIGYGTYSAVERSVHSLRAATLNAILDAQAKTLEVWIADQMVAIRRLARDREVRGQVAALAAIASQPHTTPEQYCASPVRRPLVDELNDAFAGTGAVAFNIVDRSGRIIASSFRVYCGLKLRPELLVREFDRVFNGETVFVHPARDVDRLEAPPPNLPLPGPVVWVETPVTDAAGRIIAAISVGQRAEDQFAAILAAARGGETEEVYAFDRRGNMLSQSRFNDTLVGQGRLRAGESATLTLLVQPPGAPADARTKLVDAARHSADTDVQSGMLVQPYTGYYGRDVVGAWRWLPTTRDMAIAVEVSAREAYAPLAVLRIAFGMVFGALVLAVIAALAAWFAAAKLRGKLDERRLGPYILGERIGEGGVANVFLASHELLKRPTAVKLLKPARSTDEMVARFEREAKLASQLTHPNMVEIFDYGRAPGGILYYAMEYLEGTTVGELILHGGAMPVARSVHLLRQVCAGLAEAHGKGLVHRDVSATNIMVCRYGGEYDFVKILDFGLVKSIVRGEHSQTITRSLRLLGTPLYMAPERLRDPADVDARADIYAVGAVAFFMLAGRKMFMSNDELALTSCALNETPPRLGAVAPQPIPRELEDLVARCLEKRREDRPQKVTELIEVLEVLAQTHRWTQRDAESAWLATSAPAAAAPEPGAAAAPAQAL